MRIIAVLLVFGLCSCSSPPPAAPPKAEAPPLKPKPLNEASFLPEKGRVSVEVVDDRMLGFAFAPGGTLAAYKGGGKEWRQFLLRTDSNQSAALLLLDFKKALREPKYLPAFGGYFGTLPDGKPLFVFAKNVHVAGLTGLSEKDADLPARTFAAMVP